MSIAMFSTSNPAFPGLDFGKTCAAWPVWKDSTTAEVKFHPMPKKAAVKLWHRAREFDRQTRQKGDRRHGGVVGHTALQVLHTLIFDFLNYRTGRLDPSYAAIARAANVCERAVATAIQRLKGLGVLNWLRRCEESWKDGKFVLEQDTNAYAVLPSSQWLGYREPAAAPSPAPGTWGDHPPLPDAITQALEARRDGASFATVLKLIEQDPADRLALALASFGRSIEARDAKAQ